MKNYFNKSKAGDICSAINSHHSKFLIKDEYEAQDK